jgi:hypothetical protein
LSGATGTSALSYGALQAALFSTSRKRSGSFGGVRTQRYRTALGSARESVSCLRAAEAFGYIEGIPRDLRAAFDHVIGTLVRVT